MEVVHAHDIVCQCEEADASSEESDQEVRGREAVQDDFAELPGQVEKRVADNGGQDGPPGEKGLTVWREGPLLASSETVAPVKVAVGDRGLQAVIELELDSTLHRDRTTFSNSDLVGEENLSVVPVEVSAVVPGHPGVSQSNPSEVVVFGVTQRIGALGRFAF
ncbi:hypothetical protein V6N12_009753 [Hibiscus sabdariffa]|uniref:Uncharacterized protein n=1 Tax=Hibiscus sabdariffa TaxID=183260 RepID=A0ABR1ZZY2_9ROSI